MIFLYRFDVKENHIHFVLNEQIAADMLLQYDVLLRPLVTSLAETLQLYCSLSKQPTLLTSKIQDSGEIEVMLNQELGQCIDGHIKDGSGANKGYIPKTNADSYRNRSLRC
ncbi:hypothetical protein ACQVTU_32945 [Bacillus cereus]|uniref:hypothetical protein n=1 Tax=Bacillus cereus TaxID=1396 RepID=UPI003D64B86E